MHSSPVSCCFAYEDVYCLWQHICLCIDCKHYFHIKMWICRGMHYLQLEISSTFHHSVPPYPNCTYFHQILHVSSSTKSRSEVGKLQTCCSFPLLFSPYFLLRLHRHTSTEISIHKSLVFCNQHKWACKVEEFPLLYFSFSRIFPSTFHIIKSIRFK